MYDIKYQRGASAEADIGWVGPTGALLFADGWLNASIRLNDGSNAIPQMSLSSNILTISSVQQGDRIIIEHPETGCRDEIAVVKNFSWNDLQRLGVGNLEMHPDFAALTNVVGNAIIDSIIFCLDPRDSREQKTQFTNDCFHDAGLSYSNYCGFHTTYPNLLQLDIPSARSIGLYPDDYEHWHMGLEVDALPPDIYTLKTNLSEVGMLSESYYELQSNAVPMLVDLLNRTVEHTNISFMLSHTYESGEGAFAVYVDPAGSDTLDSRDPVRSIRCDLNGSSSPQLVFGGATVYDTYPWLHQSDSAPQEVWQVSFFVDKNGKVVLVGRESTLSAVNGMISDATGYDF